MDSEKLPPWWNRCVTAVAVELADHHPTNDPDDREVRAMAERAVAACHDVIYGDRGDPDEPTRGFTMRWSRLARAVNPMGQRAGSGARCLISA